LIYAQILFKADHTCICSLHHTSYHCLSLSPTCCQYYRMNSDHSLLVERHNPTYIPYVTESVRATDFESNIYHYQLFRWESDESESWQFLFLFFGAPIQVAYFGANCRCDCQSSGHDLNKVNGRFKIDGVGTTDMRCRWSNGRKYLSFLRSQL